MSEVSSTRVWARRTVLSALAGGGLTAIGLGGSLSGALADPPVEPSSPPSETSTTPAPEAPTQTTTDPTTTSTPVPPTTPTVSESSTTPAPAPAQPTSTAPAQAPTQTQTQTQTTTVEAPQAPSHRPHVVVQHNQQPTEGEAAGSTPTTNANTPTPSTAKGPGNIAAAPQLAAAQSSALAAMIAGSAASVRALDFYRIPLYLLPIYQAAAVQYGVPWPVLAAINEVETDFGSDLSVSTAGALGWMQFMPATWLQYGVDAVNAGYADPYNPVDAIFAAARYLHAAGASSNLRAAILAYNHSDAYVESVLLRARLFASYPPSVIATLTGLTEGSLPVAGAQLSPHSTVPQGVTDPVGPVAPSPSAASSAPAAAASASTPASRKRARSVAGIPGSTPAPSPAVSAARAERALNAPAPPSQLSELLGRRNAPVLAVEDGRVVGIGSSRKLGDYLVLRDTYGDLFTYAGLGSIAPHYRLPKPAQVQVPKGALQSDEAGNDPAPKQAASAGRQLPLTLHVAKKKATPSKSKRVNPSQPGSSSQGETAAIGKVRVFAHPGNPDALAAARVAARAARRRAAAAGWIKLGRGSVVAQGTVLGHLDASTESSQATLRFAVRPTGAESAIDPRPILENWRALDGALHPQGAKDGPVLAGATASDAFLLSQPELERAVLADPGIKLGRCDRSQVAAGKVSRRSLALLVFLSRSGLKPTVGELRCGRPTYTSNGLVNVYPPAGTVDIAAINGVPIAGHQGAGTITDITIRTLLTLQRQFKPKRIVSLMKYPGAPSTLASSDHSTYIQIELPKRVSAGTVSTAGGARSAHSANARQSQTAPLVANPVLNTVEWQRLIEQVGGLQTPKLSHKPSASAIRDKPAAPGGGAPGNGGPGARLLP
ncbi:MAG TPA: lytic murein transglycosylase [Solirubrobacteraceae bacterium]|nr:lytic murein transglycosylase [Solirubrobacteraceae bacterium]